MAEADRTTTQSAEDRVFRFGQNKVVNVYTFICKGTIEELLDDILKTKRVAFDTIVNVLAERASYIIEESDPLISAVKESLSN